MPDTTVLAVAGAKGGVGKTTTSINLATAIAERDREVVVVELDLAMANLVDFLSLGLDDGDPTMHEVLSGEVDVATALVDAPGGVAVAPSGTSLSGFESVDLGTLPGVVDSLRDRFDVVVLDTAAGVNSATTAAVEIADETVLVSTPRVAAVRDADKTKTVVERTGGSVAGLLLTMTGTGSAPDSDHLAEFLDVPLLGAVPDDDSVPESQDAGVPVVERVPDGVVAAAYRDVVAELEGGVLPTVERDAPSRESLEADGWTFPGVESDDDGDVTDDSDEDAPDDLTVEATDVEEADDGEPAEATEEDDGESLEDETPAEDPAGDDPGPMPTVLDAELASASRNASTDGGPPQIDESAIPFADDGSADSESRTETADGDRDDRNESEPDDVDDGTLSGRISTFLRGSE